MNEKTILLHSIILIVFVRWAELNQTYWSPYDLTKTRDWVNKFALLRPFQLWPNVTLENFQTMKMMTDCNCPRVYWPACALLVVKARKKKDRVPKPVTFVNACISNCAGAKFMRNAPCITFRRSFPNINDTDPTDSLVGKVNVPSNWNITDQSSEDHRIFHNITLDEIRMILKSLPDKPVKSDPDEDKIYDAYIAKVAGSYLGEVVTFNDTGTSLNNTSPDKYILDVARRFNLVI